MIYHALIITYSHRLKGMDSPNTAGFNELVGKLIEKIAILQKAPELDSVFSQIAATDRSFESAVQADIASTWAALNEKNTSVTVKDIEGILNQTSPSPMTQLFIEAEMPTRESILSALQEGNRAETSAGSVVKSFFQSLFAQGPGVVDDKIMEEVAMIQSSTLPEPEVGFKVTFTFLPGAKKYFKNSTLSVAVKATEQSKQAKSFQEKLKVVEGTKIEWTEADPTIMKIALPPQAESKKKSRDGAPKKKAAEPEFMIIKQDSLFRIFESFSLEDEISEKEMPEEEERDFEMNRRMGVVNALTDFHVLTAGTPILALKRLTPDGEEMMGGADNEMDFGGEDEMMDDEEDFDDGEEEEDEEVAAPPKKTARTDGKAKQPPPQAGGKKQPECKQQ